MSYAVGSTPFFHCQADARFAYCLYVPTSPQTLCVYVHGTERDVNHYRDHLGAFAEENQVLIVAPLFPAGLYDTQDVDNYKYLLYQGVRYDHVLLSMLDEVRTAYGMDDERFLLGGFSGGAQFAQRFTYLHPERLRAVSLAAPGRVTVLDDRFDWWPGTRNVETLFGQHIDQTALREVPVQLVIGAQDNEDIPIKKGNRYWADGANQAGTTRLERVQTLYNHYQQQGIAVRYDTVEGCDHTWLPLLPPIIDFYQSILEELEENPI